MKPDDYPIFRDRLADLIRTLLTLDLLDEPDRRSLSRVLEKVRKDRFRFVLAGEFQCGKSTTFNALCDGRELSPRGSGVKTSGCVISASHLPDGEGEAHAAVEWHTAAELSEGIVELLFPRLRQLSPGRFDAGLSGDTDPILHLDDPADRALLMAAAGSEWAQWRRDRAGYDPDQEGHLDMLRCVTLIGRYWADDHLTRLRDGGTLSTADAQTLMTFPADWEARWMEGNPDRFTAREAAVIFVRAIRLHIHSPHLSRLGCVIVDCPGLFASRWDTRTARTAMGRADAILYLFDGARPLKRSDLRALSFIRDNGMVHKLFYGCNLRGLSSADSDRVLTASLESLGREGFEVARDRVVAFHARLALAAAQAEKRRNQGETATGSPPESGDRPERWMDEMRRMLAVLTGDGPEALAALSPSDLIARCRLASGLDRLMGMAESAVLRQKARSVLIDNGARMGLEILREAAGTLSNREMAARSETRSFREQVAAAETALRRFEGDCRLAIDRLSDPDADRALADDLWSRLVAERDPLCDACAGRIRKEVLVRRNLAALMARRKTIEDSIVRILKSEMETRFEGVIHGWLAEVEAGRNPVYNLRIARRVEGVGQELKHIWSRSGLEEMDLLSGMALPSFSGIPAVERDRLFREMTDRDILNDLRDHALTAASVAGIFTAASGLLAGILGAMSRVLWAAVASAAVLLVNGLILLLAKGMVKETLTAEIRSRLSPAFIRIFNDLEPEVLSAFTRFSEEIRTLYRNAFFSAVDKPRALFEDRKRQAEADFLHHREEREVIARQARRLRKESVEPLMEQLRGFIEDVAARYPPCETKTRPVPGP